ncbi:MAG: Gfo/Idh/MocA family oxidoreductase, partial [Bacteroidetes bacterium]|nr:Gfo/Idh/MocA family oxidoreductase [Bacteroidota bacterium]
MTVNIGIIGFSRYAREKFIPAILRIPDFKLSGIASQYSTNSIPESLNDIQIFRTYEELISARDIDLIYVGTANSSHLNLTELSLRFGK